MAKHRARALTAPVFPSLIAEGRKDGGYDVKLPLTGTPVFLQFKLSDKLEGSNAREHIAGLLEVPYYRMHLRATKHSDQHSLLLALETSGEAVFYIAPEFHLPVELNAHYLGREVVIHSAAFAPKAIGQLPTDDEHYVVFERDSPFGYRCSSEPVKVAKTSLRDGLRSAIVETGIESRALGEQGLLDISRRMLDALASAEVGLQRYEKSIDIGGVRRVVQQRSPLEAVSYLARAVFDVELVILE